MADIYLLATDPRNIQNPTLFGKKLALTLSASLSPPSLLRHVLSFSLRYKRYKLGNVKDFSSLFFPEKEALLTILQNFENKTGEQVVPLSFG